MMSITCTVHAYKRERERSRMNGGMDCLLYSVSRLSS